MFPEEELDAIKEFFDKTEDGSLIQFISGDYIQVCRRHVSIPFYLSVIR